MRGYSMASVVVILFFFRHNKDMEFLSQIPTWILLIGAVVVGAFVVLGLFDREKRNRGKEKDDLEDRVRVLYAEESKQLREQLEGLTEEVKKLRAENKVITEIFQGRDTTTVEFQKQGFETMRQFAITNRMIAETHKIALQNKNGLGKMGKNIEKLVNTLEKHLTREASKPTMRLPQGAEITVKKTA